VAEVYPDLVGRNPEGQAESVRYEQINAMFLTSSSKSIKRCRSKGLRSRKLKGEILNLTATVKEQAAQIQRVSAEAEMRELAPQVVLNKP
jgi:hypothetical protein